MAAMNNSKTTKISGGLLCSRDHHTLGSMQVAPNASMNGMTDAAVNIVP